MSLYWNEGASKLQIRHALLSCVRVSKMQGAEIEDEGSVLTYMAKSEIEEQRSSLLIMTQRRLYAKKQLVPLSMKCGCFF